MLTLTHHVHTTQQSLKTFINTEQYRNLNQKLNDHVSESEDLNNKEIEQLVINANKTINAKTTVPFQPLWGSAAWNAISIFVIDDKLFKNHRLTTRMITVMI